MILRHSALVLMLASLVMLQDVSGQMVGASPVKIYVMVGQSNMVGHGDMAPVGTQGTLQYLVANDPGKYGFLVDGGGDWIVRDDVWLIDEVKATSGLTAGLGSGVTRIGPELGFGHVVGNHHGNQVFIIKAAWGGKSLAADFRPPSSGGTTGYYYKLMTAVIDDAVANLGTYFPDYDGQGYEFAGFCWHQGYNDRVTLGYDTEYEANMANFINDIRAHLNVPKLPFVIATTGMGEGSTTTVVEDAQLEMANATRYPEFAGNVSVIDTRNTTYLGETYQQDVANSPASEGHHWNRNAMTYLHIGMAMGDAMGALSGPECPSRLGAAVDAAGVKLTWQNGSETPTSVRILRNGAEIAAAAAVVPASFVDETAEPGVLNYELIFTMPTATCDPLTVTYDAGITELIGYRSAAGVALEWRNNLSYTNIEVRRDNVLLTTIAGTATTYTDATAAATGSYTYSVVPTNGSAAETEVVVNLGPPSASDALVYEPFDYTVGGLNGQSGFSETGLDGAWIAHGDTNLQAGSLSYSSLPTFGASIGALPGGNRFGGSRAVSASALASNGHLDDGATLWFSAIVGLDEGGNATNSRLSLALANDRFNGGNYDYWIVDDGAQLGEGVGMTLVGNGGRVLAAHFQDLSEGDGYAGNVEGDWSGAGPTYKSGEYGLIVGKIVWGAGATDTIEIYHPGEDMILPATPSSTLTVDVDQAAFDTITFARGDKVVLDEIRFGASYAAVLGELATPDTDPPTPSTAAFSSVPTADSDTAISMTAQTGTDVSGPVEYLFTETSGNPGATSSGWQISPSYTDSGLQDSTTYSYTVTMRDSLGNTGTASSASNATTSAADNTAPSPDPMTWSVEPTAISHTEITMTATTATDPSGVEYYFTCTSGGGNDSGWQDSPIYTDAGLAASTSYGYEVKARDKSSAANETVASTPPVVATTEAPPSGPVVYEGFDYPAGGLNGSGGTSELGLDGTWSANGLTNVVATDLTYGSLPTTGGSVGNLSAGQNRPGGSRTISASALAGNGLLDDGATLWFSVIMGYGAGVNGTNARLALSLGSTGFNGNNFSYVLDQAGATGLGVTLASSGSFFATEFRDGSVGGTSGFADNVFGVGAGSAGIGANGHALVVGKFTWGASEDTLEIYLPDINLNLGTAISTLTLNGGNEVNQAAYDTLSFKRGDVVTIDEIRFGTSYEGVIVAGAAPNNYIDWIGGFSGLGGETGFGDDPDKDNHGNGLENYFGTDPGVSSSGVIAGKLSGNTFSFSHPLGDAPADDVMASYQWSTDLSTFHDDGETVGGTTVSFTQGSPSGGMVDVSASIAGAVPDSMFVRLKVQQQP